MNFISSVLDTLPEPAAHVFCRCTVARILTGSSAADSTLTFSTYTDNIACWLTCWSLSLWSVQCSLWSLSFCCVQCYLRSPSLCSVQCSLRLLSLCSLQPLCSGNGSPQSLYGLKSKRCSSQSLPPFQHSAVPKIHQWMSTAIRPQSSWHPRCCFLSPKLLYFFSQSQHYFHWQHSRPVNIYIML
jgi:hypothetical protein